MLLSIKDMLSIMRRILCLFGSMTSSGTSKLAGYDLGFFRNGTEMSFSSSKMLKKLVNLDVMVILGIGLRSHSSIEKEKKQLRTKNINILIFIAPVFG